MFFIFILYVKLVMHTKTETTNKLGDPLTSQHFGGVCIPSTLHHNVMPDHYLHNYSPNNKANQNQLVTSPNGLLLTKQEKKWEIEKYWHNSSQTIKERCTIAQKHKYQTKRSDNKYVSFSSPPTHFES